MKQVRRSVFETNSSSTHSITITHGKIANNNIRVDVPITIHMDIIVLNLPMRDGD